MFPSIKHAPWRPMGVSLIVREAADNCALPKGRELCIGASYSGIPRGDGDKRR